MPVYRVSFYEAKDCYIIIFKSSRWTFKGPCEAKCNAMKSNLGQLHGESLFLITTKGNKMYTSKSLRAHRSY